MKFTQIPRPAPPAGGLAALGEVALSPANQNLLDQAYAAAEGQPVWRQRRRNEVRELLAMTQICDRLRIQFLDLRETLRILLHMRVPVPCLPDPGGDLVVAPEAVLGLTYPAEALRQQLPGYAFIQILSPAHVWHPNVGRDRMQALCLGARLPAAIRCKELVLSAYGALSLQTVQMDVFDPAGVLNVEAALWWQRNGRRIPLSRTPFLQPDPPEERRQP
jgi:hypothetical protein